ncbi:ArnT family glycosyltransferase [Aquabacterium sp.]|uniref:ArnT family glycosyltransferase n=1 Tax=Aquabacterium sp. TaxID=1872578 RepID=UPI002E32E3BD|nr:glycosyltransferase family 39 protein [Aquabacterium sp.]HEX5312333.1 glycosyltransferase family 39 protein [Aquabacterium sp.]
MSRTLHSPDTTAAAATARSPDRPWLVVWCVLALVAAWVALSAHTHTALHHDMAEQFVWAHSWQLGYPKHPPLPTWLFMLAQTFLPPRPATLYGLSALCIGLTGVFTYLASRELMGPRLALFAACLWGLQQPFGWRAWIYNHNTVLVMTVSMAVYFAARAARRGEQWAWAGVGLGAGLAMSTKLQAAVPLVGILWALWRSGVMESLAARKGAAMAVLLGALVSAAPLLWMATGHTNALTYATHQLGSGEAEGESMRMGQFIVSELRMLAPALLVLMIWVARSYGQAGTQANAHSARGDNHAFIRAWVEGLLFVPIAFVLAMGIFGGAKLHAQWGVQTFQFMAIALVAWFGGQFARSRTRALLLTVALFQGVMLVVAASPAGQRLHAPGAVQGYPAQELADRVQADWQALAPGCALRYADAPFFEGGQLSAYGRGFPAVRQTGPKQDSPWIDEADMEAKGSVVMRHLAQQLPPDVIHTPEMALVPPPRVKGVVPIVWGVRLPKGPCEPDGVRK